MIDMFTALQTAQAGNKQPTMGQGHRTHISKSERYDEQEVLANCVSIGHHVALRCASSLFSKALAWVF